MAECTVEWKNGKIVCLLPITLSTGKIRAKKQDGTPIPARQVVLGGDDVLEWQISYYDKEKNSLVEAGRMLELAYQYGVLTAEDMKELNRYVTNVPDLFDKSFKITEERTNKKFLGEFEVRFRRTPILHKDLDNGCFVEAELKHKQKAVGYQPMLYVFIPVHNVVATPPLIGRQAQQKEIVRWSPTKNDTIGIIKTFSVLSSNHKADINRIIDRLLKSPISQ